MNASNVLVRIVSRADGAATPLDGHYVVRMEFEDDRAVLETTPDVELATAFDFESAMNSWRAVHPTEPTRPWDGQPNRPFTAYSIEVEQAGEGAEA